jgi:hypothetical protein
MRGVELSRRSKEGEAAGLNTSSSEEKAAGNPLWQGLILVAVQIVRFLESVKLAKTKRSSGKRSAECG